MSNIKIWYHAQCFDGFGAAYAAWKKFGDQADYIPMYYDTPLPPIKPTDTIFMLDYCRKANDLLHIARNAHSLIILDHHKTAIPEVEIMKKHVGDLTRSEDLYYVDITRSGAGIAWEYFHTHKPVPVLLQHIQDRDLWKFELSNTKRIHAALCSYPFDFSIWDNLVELCKSPSGQRVLCERGDIILEYHNLLTDQLCNQAYITNIQGYHVPCVNICILFSEVPHKLLELYPDAPFAAYRYFRKGGVVQFGLRGRGDIDVSKIAKTFGGGGHNDAAGFEIQEHLLYELAY